MSRLIQFVRRWWNGTPASYAWTPLDDEQAEDDIGRELRMSRGSMTAAQIRAQELRNRLLTEEPGGCVTGGRGAGPGDRSRVAGSAWVRNPRAPDPEATATRPPGLI